MYLSNASIKHYKSLDNVEVNFSQITLIVGTNGTGKSNFVDALKFFRDSVNDGLDHAIIRREGIDRIRQNYKSRPFNVSMHFNFIQEEFQNSHAAYSFSLSGKAGEYRVENEQANYYSKEYFWNDKEDELAPEERVVHKIFDRKKDGSIEINGDRYEKKIRSDAMAFGHLLDLENIGDSIVEKIADWRFCSLYPNTLRKLSPPIKGDILEEDGSNWASVVRLLKRTKNGRQSLERIAEVMRVAVGGYEDISVETAGSYLVPRITLKSSEINSQKLQKFDPIQLSDGTLRVFGILLALYQQPPPALLVIEEPEQTIHPGVLPALADAIKEASEQTQIIITTHSPHLVDQFPPEDIRVVWLEDTLTKISPIKSSQIEAVKRNLMSLQEFMLAEGLKPEA